MNNKISKTTHYTGDIKTTGPQSSSNGNTGRRVVRIIDFKFYFYQVDLSFFPVCHLLQGH